jgi:hypothetical protein
MAGRADVSSELILQHSVGVAKLDCVIDRRVTPPRWVSCLWLLGPDGPSLGSFLKRSIRAISNRHFGIVLRGS